MLGANHLPELVAAGIPNNPPRWPEATAIVKRILSAYKEDARDWERINDWIERIGWPRFLNLLNYHLQNITLIIGVVVEKLNSSAYVRF